MYLLKFLGVGGIATIVQYIIFVILIELLKIDIVLASAIGYTISSIFNYLLNYYFTFTSKVKHHVAMVKFALIVLIGLSLNSFIIHVLVDMLNMHYLLSQIITTGIVLIFNFVAHKFWTYKENIGNIHVK
ncbi:MAG: putative flippase GtrA [Colwellia sp.]|jgi:putative flippase GtrA